MERPRHHESEPRPDTHAFFHAEYCDPDRDVIDLVDGELVRFSSTVFYGGNDETLFILRAGVNSQQQLLHWLGSYDRQTGAVTVYDVAEDIEIDDNPRLGTYGSFLKTVTYEAKPRGNEDTTAYFHFNSHFIEWRVDDTVKPVDMLAPPQ